MKRKLINSQLTTIKTFLKNKVECEMIAENSFQIKKIPKGSLIDIDNVNEYLLSNGSIAWFVDEELGLLALPYVSLAGKDINGKPTYIEVKGANGYNRKLYRKDFVIMYDNNKKISLKWIINQYAERLTLCDRTIDVNIGQQKTPRIWKTNPNQVESVKGLLNEIDGYENEVVGFEDLLTEGLECVLQPAPFISDKVRLEKNAIWNEYLRLIGVANLTVQKKERNIKDEVMASLGGTIVSRFNRYSPRLTAIEEIKEKFNIELELEYYDGIPTNYEKENDGGDLDVNDNV